MYTRVELYSALIILLSEYVFHVFQMTSQRPVFCRIPPVFHVFHGIRRIPSSKNGRIPYKIFFAPERIHTEIRVGSPDKTQGRGGWVTERLRPPATERLAGGRGEHNEGTSETQHKKGRTHVSITGMRSGDTHICRISPAGIVCLSPICSG